MKIKHCVLFAFNALAGKRMKTFFFIFAPNDQTTWRWNIRIFKRQTKIRVVITAIAVIPTVGPCQKHFNRCWNWSMKEDDCPSKTTLIWKEYVSDMIFLRWAWKLQWPMRVILQSFNDCNVRRAYLLTSRCYWQRWTHSGRRWLLSNSAEDVNTFFRFTFCYVF